MREPGISVIFLVLLLGAAPGQGQGESTLHDHFAARLEGARTELIEVRRDLHRHPEVSGEEERTAGVVAERLRGLGLEVRTGVGGHLTTMSLLPKSIHRCRRYPTKFNSGRDIPRTCRGRSCAVLRGSRQDRFHTQPVRVARRGGHAPGE